MTNRSDPAPPRAVEEAMPPFARLMGVRVTAASLDRIEADLDVGADYLNRNGVLHGGAVMAFADILGGAASVLNLPAGICPRLDREQNQLLPGDPGGRDRPCCVRALAPGTNHDGMADDDHGR
jgi:acyl-coenzyme A thioesterase PaaI-like protein